MSDNIKEASLDDFNADVADAVVGLLAGAVGVEPGMKKWALRLLWTLGQVPAISSQVEFDAHASTLSILIEQNVGKQTDPRVFRNFVYGPHGAEAIALIARMAAWREREAN